MPKGDSPCCRLYKLRKEEKLADQTTWYKVGDIAELTSSEKW